MGGKVIDRYDRKVRAGGGDYDVPEHIFFPLFLEFHKLILFLDCQSTSRPISTAIPLFPSPFKVV